MCMTIGQEEAQLSNTQIYVGEAMRDGKLFHVLAYQNTAVSVGANAMILPFPTSEPMGPNNIIDTRAFGNFLTDIGEASRIHMKSDRRGMTLGADSFAFNSIAQVFDSGSYTVILADHVGQIQEALTRVDAEKRPEVSDDFLEGFGKLYPNQPIALCCWKGMLDSEPLLWIYEPKNPEVLFVPTMDAHDGNAPNVNAMVQADHLISAGSRVVEIGSTVRYSDGIAPSELSDLLPSRVRGYKLNRRVKNGDMFISTADLRKADQLFIKRGAQYSNDLNKEAMNGWY